MNDEEKKYLIDVLNKALAYNGIRIVNNLEEENEELKAQIEQLKQAYTITVDKSVTREQELEAQIEKMENCWNCKFFKEKKYQACIDYKKNNTKCCAFYKWELAE